MSNKIRFLGFFVMLLLIASACGLPGALASPTPLPSATSSAVPTATATRPPTPTRTATATPTALADQPFTTVGSLGYVFSAGVPSAWVSYAYWVYLPIGPSGITSGHSPDLLEYAYVSPDRHAATIFLQYDDNHTLPASQLGRAAETILDNFFAKGQDALDLSFGKAGEKINVTQTDPLADGSLQLSWELAANQVVGTSRVYQRGTKIIVLSTLSEQDYSAAYADLFARITASYKVP